MAISKAQSIHTSSVSKRERTKEREKKKAQARLKQETKIPLIHKLYGILLLNDFELFYAC